MRKDKYLLSDSLITNPLSVILSPLQGREGTS